MDSQDSNPGTSPMKLLHVKIKSFQKMNPMKHFLVELLAGITLKIRVKCYE